jgi:hypothetical protein
VRVVVVVVLVLVKLVLPDCSRRLPEHRTENKRSKVCLVAWQQIPWGVALKAFNALLLVSHAVAVQQQLSRVC